MRSAVGVDQGADQGLPGRDVQGGEEGLATSGITERHISAKTEQRTGATALRPFHVDIPEEALDDLRRRLATTRWRQKELVEDSSQGVQLGSTSTSST